MKKLSLILMLVWWLGRPQPVAAEQKDIDLMVAPAATYLTVKPGETQRHTITLTQNGTLPLRITPKIVDFHPDEQTGAPVLDDGTTASFVTIEPLPNQSWASFPLLPHSAQPITLVLTPKTETVQKEYPLSIIFTAEPQTDQLGSKSSGSTTSALMVSHLIVTVGNKSTSPTDIKIAQISAPRIIDSLSELKFAIMAENSGSSANEVHGQVKIYRWFTQEVASFELESDIILGKSQRPLRPKSGSDPTFRYDAPFLIGPYSIEVYLYSPTQPDIKTSVVTTKVLALPISLGLIIILSILVYIFWRWKKIHKYILASISKSITVNA